MDWSEIIFSTRWIDTQNHIYVGKLLARIVLYNRYRIKRYCSLWTDLNAQTIACNFEWTLLNTHTRARPYTSIIFASFLSGPDAHCAFVFFSPPGRPHTHNTISNLGAPWWRCVECAAISSKVGKEPRRRNFPAKSHAKCTLRRQDGRRRR